MEKSEFWDTVERKCPPNIRKVVPDAREIISDDIFEYERGSISKVVQLIGRLAPLVLSREEDYEKKLSQITPEVLISSDFLGEKIRPWVFMLRRKLFRTTEVPFDGMDEAGMWIESEALKAKASTQEAEPLGTLKLMDVAEQSSNMGGDVIVNPPPVLEYLGSDGSLKYAQSLPPKFSIQYFFAKSIAEKNGELVRSPLIELAVEVKGMSRDVGFDKASLVGYVLADIKPILPRYRVRTGLEYCGLPSGETIESLSVEVSIKAKDLTFNELLSIYQDIRGMCKIEKSKPLTKKHLDLYQLINELGGPPEDRGKVRFWENARETWNSRYPKNKYKTWNGVKKQYNSIVQRVQWKYEVSKRDVMPTQSMRSIRKTGGDDFQW